MADGARLGDTTRMHEGAEETLDILLGRTHGRIYDGFPLLNFNRWNSPEVGAEHFTPDSVPGEYKMKTLSCTDETEPSWKDDGNQVRIWEVNVNHFWYGQQLDSDTFLIHLPTEVDCDGVITPVSLDDALRVNWTIYSLVEEDFAPTSVMRDAQLNMPGQAADTPGASRGGTVRFPFKGLDSVWVRIQPRTKVVMKVAHPPLRFIRGIYTWGWNVHPPRIQFIQPIADIIDKDNNTVPDPQARSFRQRNGALSIDGIGDAAPEKKLYKVAKAVLDGATPEVIHAMLNDPETEPQVGSWQSWINLMEDQRQLPPEARAILEAENRSIADYDFVTVYANNEMYGEGTLLHTIRTWSQGEEMTVKLINLDNHTHYFRNVGFGAPLHNDLGQNVDDGIFSFEIMNFKPLYGAPKVAEMQWRAGFGFRPHYGAVQQQDVFPRRSDRRLLKPFYAYRFGFPLDSAGNLTQPGRGEVYYGYQFKKAETEPFSFNPPAFIIGTTSDPAPETLWDLSTAAPRQKPPLAEWVYNKLLLTKLKLIGDLEQFQDLNNPQGEPYLKPGLIIGQTTEGWGTAQICPEDTYPDFCSFDMSGLHPLGNKNWPAPNDPSVTKTELRFPPFLRNPAQGNELAGDIIPPTPSWEPFLFIHPQNGTLWNDPNDHSKGHWVDKTMAHGAPIFAGEHKAITIEMPRASGQLFYQFDDLFHDNAIFSPHPIIDSGLP